MADLGERLAGIISDSSVKVIDAPKPPNEKPAAKSTEVAKPVVSPEKQSQPANTPSVTREASSLGRVRGLTLLAGMSLLLALCVYLPWTFTLNHYVSRTGVYGEYPETSTRRETPAPYGFIFLPPQPPSTYEGTRVDLTRLFISMFAVVLATCLCYCVLPRLPWLQPK
jgi:hypothetical protein